MVDDHTYKPSRYKTIFDQKSRKMWQVLAGAALSALMNKRTQENAAEIQNEYNSLAMDKAYRLNEQAAENAQKRQNEFYNMTYEKESPAARRKQLEDAGLSVGLMYKGAGAGGFGGGSTGGQAGGGTSALGNSAAGMQMDPLALAQIDLIKAQAEEARAGAEQKKADANATNLKTPFEIEKVRNEAVSIWQQNILEKTKGEHKNGEVFTDHYINQVLAENFTVGDQTINGREITGRMIKIIGESGNALAQAALTNKEVNSYAEKLAALVMTAEASRDQANAAIEQAQNMAKEIEYKYGEEWTTKTLTEFICGIVATGSSVVSSVSNAMTFYKMITGRSMPEGMQTQMRNLAEAWHTTTTAVD